MGMLFDCSTDNVGLHLKNIFASGELVKDSVTEKISATASDGKNYVTQFYNLDAVISVGYLFMEKNTKTQKHVKRVQKVQKSEKHVKRVRKKPPIKTSVDGDRARG